MLIHFDTAWIHADTYGCVLMDLMFFEAIFQRPLQSCAPCENEPPARGLSGHGSNPSLC